VAEVKLRISEDNFGLVDKAFWERLPRQRRFVFCYKLNTMLPVCHKLKRINEVYMLNLGQIYASERGV